MLCIAALELCAGWGGVDPWGTAAELLSVLGVKGTFHSWIWGLLPQQHIHT